MSLHCSLLQSHAPEGVPEPYSAVASQHQRKAKDAFESFSQICIRVVTTKRDVSALHVHTNVDMKHECLLCALYSCRICLRSSLLQNPILLAHFMQRLIEGHQVIKLIIALHFYLLQIVNLLLQSCGYQSFIRTLMQ